MLYSNKNFKKTTKNLKKELSELGFELSHGAALNLLAETLGHKDYNTIKPHLSDDEQRFTHNPFLNNSSLENSGPEIERFIEVVNKKRINNLEKLEGLVLRLFPFNKEAKFEYQFTQECELGFMHNVFDTEFNRYALLISYDENGNYYKINSCKLNEQV